MGRKSSWRQLSRQAWGWTLDLDSKPSAPAMRSYDGQFDVLWTDQHSSSADPPKSRRRLYRNKEIAKCMNARRLSSLCFSFLHSNERRTRRDLHHSCHRLISNPDLWRVSHGIKKLMWEGVSSPDMWKSSSTAQTVWKERLCTVEEEQGRDSSMTTTEKITGSVCTKRLIGC